MTDVIRLAALGLSHEANTFSVHLMDEQTMQETGVLFGDDIVAIHRDNTSTMSGFLAAGVAADVEVVPLVMTALVPRGAITADALEARATEMVDALRQHGPFDGVLAALHGAAVADGCLDVDGHLLSRIREVVGPDVPIGVSLDLHANISAAMCEHADVVNTYRTNPHLDAKEVAEEMANLVIRTARGEIRPTMALEPLPLVVNILCQDTTVPPMSDVMTDVRATMTEPGVLSATVAEGFPYADVPEMGMAVVVVTDGDHDAASRHARALGAKVWARRDELQMTAPSAVEAIERVLSATNGPILLLDVGDNIGGGSPGDSVVLLDAARVKGLASLLIIVADPSAVDVCVEAGIGRTVRLNIGAKGGPECGPAVDASATVLAFDDFVHSATGESVHAGMRDLDAGASAAVRLDTGQTVILTTKVAPPFSIAQVTRLGLDPSDFAAIVGKGVHSPKSTYAPYVTEMIMVDTPGTTSADLGTFDYQHRRRPLYPFEPDAVYPPEPA